MNGPLPTVFREQIERGVSYRLEMRISDLELRRHPALAGQPVEYLAPMLRVILRETRTVEVSYSPTTAKMILVVRSQP